MDIDLEAMRSIARFNKCVIYCLEPLLEERRLIPMPCKHGKTFDAADAARRQRYAGSGLEDSGDDTIDRVGYCDCGTFNRRAELWQSGDLIGAGGRNLNIKQLRELAAVLLVVTKESFTSNHVKRAMHDLFNGKYSTFLEQVAKKREEGLSFNEIAAGVVPQWQYRMMPNI